MSEEVTGRDVVNAGKGVAEMAAGKPPSLQEVKSTGRLARPLMRACCLGEIFLLGFAVLIVLNLVNPSISGADETGSSNEGATAGATVPNTVTEMTVGGKTIKIPATKGKTSSEQYLPGMTFSSQCNATEEKWYITMRWPYVKWKFNGHSALVDAATTNTKFSYATVRVIVYNPDTKKTVVTAICESGPAPWTGSSWYSKLPADTRSSLHDIVVAATNNPPSFWETAHQFDPPEADGRVSGLSPSVFKAIGAKNNGVMEYGFAEDQNIPLGPIN